MEMASESPQIYNNLGGALRNLGRLDEALASYRQALTLKPDFAQAHSNLGAVLHERRLIAEAMACYQKAIEIDPSLFDAHNNMGVALQQCRTIQSSARQLSAHTGNQSGFHRVPEQSGSILAELGHLEEAASSYRQASEASPILSGAHSNLLLIHNYLADQTPAELLAEANALGKAWPNSSSRILAGTTSPTRTLLARRDRISRFA